MAVGSDFGYFDKERFPDKCWVDKDPLAVNQFWEGKSTWYPSWNYPESHDSALQIDSVKVWQYPDEDKDSSFTNNIQKEHTPLDEKFFYHNQHATVANENKNSTQKGFDLNDSKSLNGMNQILKVMR
jgi:hypothetical protein